MNGQHLLFNNGRRLPYWCVSMAALGFPVEPLVNWRLQTSKDESISCRRCTAWDGTELPKLITSSYVFKLPYVPLKIIVSSSCGSSLEICDGEAKFSKASSRLCRPMRGTINSSLQPMISVRNQQQSQLWTVLEQSMGHTRMFESIYQFRMGVRVIDHHQNGSNASCGEKQ